MEPAIRRKQEEQAVCELKPGLQHRQRDCVIAGIAPSDFVELGRTHSHPLIAAFDRYGAPPEAEARAVLRVVSPLAVPPRAPWTNRYLFGGPADRMVPRHVRALW